MKIKQKTLILTLAGISTMLFLIVGATFAYFTSSDVSDGKTSVVTGNATPVGNVSLINPTDSLHLNLSILDMQEDNLNTYWATDDVTKNYDTEEVQRDIAVATLTGGSKTTLYECSAVVNVEIDGSITSFLSKGDAYIQFGGLLTNKIDLTEISAEGYLVNFSLNGNDLLTQKITAAIAIENRNANQNSIAGKELSIKFKNTDFNCKALGYTEKEASSSTGELALNSAASNLLDYKIYGNSIQNGTPTPSNPVEIQSVGVRTDNLFDFQKLKGQTGGVVDFENESIYLSGSDNMYVIGQSFTGAPTAFNKFNEVLNVSEPGYYSLSIKVDSEYENISPRANYMLNVLGTDVVAPTTVSSVYKNGHLFVTYNITEEALTSLKTNASTFRIYMYSFKTADGSNVPVTLSEFMFVKGNYASDTMPSYEPNGYKIPIVSNGKNLFDPEMLKHSCYKVDNNKLTVTCNNGTAWNSLNYLALSPNTQYTLSVENKSLIDVRTPANVRLISQMTGTDVTFTTDSTGLVVVKFFEQENKYPYEVGFVQLEQSSKPSIYVDYVEPLISNIYLDEPLRKVGNVADYIDFENKTIVRRVGRFNEINSLNWSLSSNYFQAALGFNVNVENRVGSLSNYLLYGDARSDKAFWIDSSGTGIRIVNSDYSDLTSFNEWLNTLNMYVIYPLASKKEEKLELPNIPTFEGNTTIKVNTPIAPSNIDIKYNSR